MFKDQRKKGRSICKTIQLTSTKPKPRFFNPAWLYDNKIEFWNIIGKEVR